MSISAKIIAASLNRSAQRIITFELEYPRFIHSEFMTHRVFSRNAASSRAIPINTSIALIENDTAIPVHWGKNQPGMSASTETDARIEGVGSYAMTREEAWNAARDSAIHIARQFANSGYHKQIINRLLEPFSHIKVVMTTTELANWFELRYHKDAQPEIYELAEKMLYAVTVNSETPVLGAGDWHTPYYRDGHWKAHREINGSVVDIDGVTLSDALAISSSCCAQVSYRKMDDSVEKAKNIYARLVLSSPPHLSPFEHQATPMEDKLGLAQDGATHIDKFGSVWSGNFRGWVQHRQIIKI